MICKCVMGCDVFIQDLDLLSDLSVPCVDFVSDTNVSPMKNVIIYVVNFVAPCISFVVGLCDDSKNMYVCSWLRRTLALPEYIFLFWIK